MKYILYNPRAGKSGSFAQCVERLKSIFGEESRLLDVTAIESYEALFSSVDESNEVIVCGGDGTLNRFINATDGMDIPGTILYYPGGSGNDFLRDVQAQGQELPLPIGEYIQDLPVVTVKGKKYRFLNGVGYGIDGYCCEVGDRLRAQSDKKVDYTMIAIKGLLFHYRPTKATVIVDGQTFSYERVWIAPTMNGRFYGGGMMPAPNQDRLMKDKTLSLLVMHNCGKLKILYIFPNIFKGKHLRFAKQVALHTGRDITVKFDRPVTLQIDGETIFNVTEYRATVENTAVVATTPSAATI